MIELLESLGYIVHRNGNNGVESKHIVVTYYNARPSLHASGRLLRKTQYIQVDLYFKGDTDADRIKIETAIRGAGYGITDIRELSDDGYNRVMFDCVVTSA